VTVTAAPVHDEPEIEQAIKGLTDEPNGGLLFPTDTFLTVHGKLIVETSAHYRSSGYLCRRGIRSRGRANVLWHCV